MKISIILFFAFVAFSPEVTLNGDAGLESMILGEWKLTKIIHERKISISGRNTDRNDLLRKPEDTLSTDSYFNTMLKTNEYFLFGKDGTLTVLENISTEIYSNVSYSLQHDTIFLYNSYGARYGMQIIKLNKKELVVNANILDHSFSSERYIYEFKRK